MLTPSQAIAFVLARVRLGRGEPGAEETRPPVLRKKARRLRIDKQRVARRDYEIKGIEPHG